MYVLVCVDCCCKDSRDWDLNNKHLFLTVLEARKSKIKMPADSVFSVW